METNTYWLCFCKDLVESIMVKHSHKIALDYNHYQHRSPRSSCLASSSSFIFFFFFFLLLNNGQLWNLASSCSLKRTDLCHSSNTFVGWVEYYYKVWRATMNTTERNLVKCKSKKKKSNSCRFPILNLLASFSDFSNVS